MSAQVEEVTTSAQWLAEMAKELQKLVGQFKFMDRENNLDHLLTEGQVRKQDHTALKNKETEQRIKKDMSPVEISERKRSWA